MRRFLVPSFIIATLSACTGTSYPVITDRMVDVTVAQNNLTAVTADGHSLTLARTGVYDKGEFAGALDYGNGGGMIAAYATDAASASIVVRQTAGGDFANVSVERLTVITPPLSGAASYTGDYVGTLLSDGDPRGANQVRGDLTLDVDFADQTIEGQITDRTAYLSGMQGLLTLNTPTIDLVKTDIDNQGSFSGQATMGEDTGTYAGLLAGDSASEIVGTVDLKGEIGVFAGGKD